MPRAREMTATTMAPKKIAGFFIGSIPSFFKRKHQDKKLAIYPSAFFADLASQAIKLTWQQPWVWQRSYQRYHRSTRRRQRQEHHSCSGDGEPPSSRLRAGRRQQQEQ